MVTRPQIQKSSPLPAPFLPNFKVIQAKEWTMHRLLYLALSGLPGEESAAKLLKTSYAGCLPLCQCEDKKKNQEP